LLISIEKADFSLPGKAGETLPDRECLPSYQSFPPLRALKSSALGWGRRNRKMKSMGSALIVPLSRRLNLWLEAFEQQHAAQESTGLAPGLLHFPAFLIRLTEEITRAERYQRELELMVLQAPILPQQKQRAVEVALRQASRRSDLPARISEHLRGVLLPETGRGAEAAAARLAFLLSGVAGTAVTGGFVRYPADGRKVVDLMRIATERSSAPVGF
jgi:hypothetical protein